MFERTKTAVAQPTNYKEFNEHGSRYIPENGKQDTEKMTLEVSEHRKLELLELLKVWKRKDSFKKKQLQSLIGKLSFVTNCVRPGRIFLARLIEKLKGTEDSKWYPVSLSMKLDVEWWLQYLPTFEGVSTLWLYDITQVDCLMASDASLIGGRTTCGKEFFHFKFSENIIKNTNNIAQRELYTIVVAVKMWKSELKRKIVRFSTDSQVAMYAINKGNTNDNFMLNCLRELTWICAENEILLKASYINTKVNTLPDTLSRWYQSSEARRTVKRLTDNSWKRRSITDSTTNFSTFEFLQA